MSVKYGKQKYCRVLRIDNATNRSKVKKYVSLDYAKEVKERLLIKNSLN